MIRLCSCRNHRTWIHFGVNNFKVMRANTRSKHARTISMFCHACKAWMFDACSRCEITARIWFVEASSHASYTKHTPRTSLGTHGARPFARACKSRAHQRMRTSAPGHAKVLVQAYCNANSAMKLCCTDLHACVGCCLRIKSRIRPHRWHLPARAPRSPPPPSSASSWGPGFCHASQQQSWIWCCMR